MRRPWIWVPVTNAPNAQPACHPRTPSQPDRQISLSVLSSSKAWRSTHRRCSWRISGCFEAQIHSPSLWHISCWPTRSLFASPTVLPSGSGSHATLFSKRCVHGDEADPCGQVGVEQSRASSVREPESRSTASTHLQRLRKPVETPRTSTLLPTKPSG